MASQAEIERTYGYMDRMFRAALGKHADISCAYYHGEYSKTLEQAQRDKHAHVLEQVRFRPGMRVLDIGCGWGPMLQAVRERGGEGVGLTLSPTQAKVCQRDGFQVHLKDWKDLRKDEIGPFGAVVSLGAFEHFCSVKDYTAGKQDEVYASFFALCHSLLPQGGRLFLQTMVWDKNRPPLERISLRSPKGSNEYLLALLEKFYPGSWLPEGKEQIVKAAQGFSLVSAESGRQDYIHTMRAWGARVYRWSPRTLLLAARLVPRYVRSRDFRYQIESLRRAANRACFEREIMDHYRLVFEKC